MKLDPGNRIAHLKYGAALLRMNKAKVLLLCVIHSCFYHYVCLQSAIEQFSLARDIDALHPAAYSAIGLAYAQHLRQFKLAEEVLLKAIEVCDLLRLMATDECFNQVHGHS